MTEQANIGALTIDLLLENKQFKAGAKKIEGDAKALGDSIQSRMKGAFSGVTTAVGKFANGAKSVLNGLKNFILSWKTLIGGALIAAFTVKAVTAVKNFAKGVIEASSSYEQLRLTLKVLLKDQDKANAAFDEARKLAADTAFSIQEIVGSYAQLLTFGFQQNKIPDILMLAADAATAFGKNIDEVIHALSYLKAGRAGEALESLARFGITRDALKAKGVEFGGGGELKTSYDEVLEAVYATWKETVGGMSEEGIKTWKGMVSNLKDAWTELQVKIGDAGFFDAVKDALRWILDKTNEWFDSGRADKWAAKVSGHLQGLFMIITEAGKLMGRVFGIDKGTKESGPSRGYIKKQSKEENEEIAALTERYNSLKTAREANNMEIGMSLDRFIELNRVQKETTDATEEAMTVEEKYDQLRQGYIENGLIMNQTLEEYKAGLEDAKKAKDDLNKSEKSSDEDNIPQKYKDIAAGIASVSGKGGIGETLTDTFKGILGDGSFKTAVVGIADFIRTTILAGIPTAGEIIARTVLGNKGYEKITNIGANLGQKYQDFLSNTDYITAQRGVAINEVLIGDVKKGLKDLADINKAADEYKNATAELINNTGNVLTELVALSIAASNRAKDIRKRLLNEDPWDGAVRDSTGFVVDTE